MSIHITVDDHDVPPREKSFQEWNELLKTWHSLLVIARMSGDRRREARAESGIERCEAAFKRLQSKVVELTWH